MDHYDSQQLDSGNNWIITQPGFLATVPLQKSTFAMSYDELVIVVLFNYGLWVMLPHDWNHCMPSLASKTLQPNTHFATENGSHIFRQVVRPGTLA